MTLIAFKSFFLFGIYWGLNDITQSNLPPAKSRDLVSVFNSHLGNTLDVLNPVLSICCMHIILLYPLVALVSICHGTHA